MKSSLVCIIFTILFTLTKTPISESRPIKIRRSELEELSAIWKQACSCLDTMEKMTGEDARSKGEGVPKEAVKELGNLMKIITVFNMRMEEALLDFFTNNTESIEKSEELRQWRLQLETAIKKVKNQVVTISNNIGVKVISGTSLEVVERQMEKLRDKCLGISLCLRNSNFGFEKRYFELVGRLIRDESESPM